MVTKHNDRQNPAAYIGLQTVGMMTTLDRFDQLYKNTISAVKRTKLSKTGVRWAWSALNFYEILNVIDN